MTPRQELEKQISQALFVNALSPDVTVPLPALRAVLDEQVEQPFDISLGINKYRPCPQCLADFGMGLVTKNSAMAVQCICGFRGPSLQYCTPSWRVDKWAFEAWNDLPREAERIATLEASLAGIGELLSMAPCVCVASAKYTCTRCKAFAAAPATSLRDKPEGV